MTAPDEAAAECDDKTSQDCTGNCDPQNTQKFRSVLDYDSFDSLLSALNHDQASACEEGQESDWIIDKVDPLTSRDQSAAYEAKRLQVLQSYLILDADHEASFERITSLARNMFRVPISILSLMDLGRQFFLSGRGIGELRNGPRHTAVCSHTLLTTLDMVIIPDVEQDVRFSGNPRITAQGIRFYAGVPLIGEEGYALGTLCICDVKPRPEGLALKDKINMTELASLAVETMANRRREKIRLSNDQRKMVACIAHDLMTPLCAMQLSLSVLLEDAEGQDSNNGSSSSLTQEQVELVQTAVSCGDMMQKICHETIENLTDASLNVKRSLLRHGRRGGSPPVERTSSYGSVLEFAPSRPNAPEITFVGKKPVQVSPLVTKIRQVLDTYPKHVPIQIEIDSNVPATIISDELKIVRSAINFLTNACKHTKYGAITLQISVKENEVKNGPFPQVLCFECRDTGEGVDHTKHKLLFTPFKPTMNGEGESTIQTLMQMKRFGLGLFSVANNIASLGGEYGYKPLVEGESTGSIFWFCIPLILPSLDVEELRSKRPSALDEIMTSNADRAATITDIMLSEPHALIGEMQVDEIYTGVNEVEAELDTHKGERRLPRRKSVSFSINGPMNGSINGVCEHRTSSRPTSRRNSAAEKKSRISRALVIDDSLSIRKTVTRALVKGGFTVCNAANGMEGLSKLKKNCYDVVLCDFLMPVMDGLDCVAAYRTWESHNRPVFKHFIIGMSAHASLEDAKRGIDAGMDGFVVKPVPFKFIKELPGTPEVLHVSAILDDLYSQDMLAFEESDIESDKEGASSEESEMSSSMDQPTCLIAADSNTFTKPMLEKIRRKGWIAHVVSSGTDSFSLLKIRNWGAVFLDDAITGMKGSEVIVQFREWEKQHRVACQRNVIYLSENLNKAYPSQFDGAIRKPVSMKDLTDLLQVAREQTFGACDIMLR